MSPKGFVVCLGENVSTAAFEFCSGICHQEWPRKQRLMELNVTLAFGLCC